MKKKYIHQRKNSLTTAEVNTGVVGDPLHLAMKSGHAIDFMEALKYPLSPILLILGFPDGTKRSPAKSSLMKIIDYTQIIEDGAYANIDVYIVDLMAAIRAIGIFLTVEELLINRVLTIIPRDCGRVDLVADSYRETSWKKSTSAGRGEGSLTILKSAKVKIQDTNAFQRENENKFPLIKLFFNWLIDSKRKTLNTLRTTSLYLST